MDRPPCWPEGHACPNPCAAQLRTRVIRNQTPLYGEWAGWRMAGRCLVSPDGDRISRSGSEGCCSSKRAGSESRNGERV
jgi:hypothetical protein